MTNIVDHQQRPVPAVFLSHLVALLSVYELGPSSASIPRYDGYSDKQTDIILKSLAAMARRMYTAEDTLASIKASESWQSNGPDSKKRRSVGDIPSPPTTNNHHHIRHSVSGTNGEANGNSFSNNNNAGDNSDHDVDMQSDDDHLLTSTTGSRPEHISLDNVSRISTTAKPTTQSAPPASSHATHSFCPTCARPITDTATLGRVYSGSPSGSPLVVPPGPLATAAFESGMSAVEELRLLKAQVQDVARVCNAVARGDLSQKITVPVQGVVMVQLKDVINTMVRILQIAGIIYTPQTNIVCRLISSVSLQRKSLVSVRRSEQKGYYHFRLFSFCFAHPPHLLGNSAVKHSYSTLKAPGVNSQASSTTSQQISPVKSVQLQK
jgi:osomolarity two-component system sensor histidine kinase NIK1